MIPFASPARHPRTFNSPLANSPLANSPFANSPFANAPFARVRALAMGIGLCVIGTTSAAAAPLGRVALAIDAQSAEKPAALARIRDQVSVELADAGFAVLAAPPLAAACLEDLTCLQQARAQAALDGIVALSVLRVGPIVTITATAAGATATAKGERSLSDKELAAGPLLSDEVRTWAQSLQEHLAATRTGTATAPATAATAPAVAERTQPEPANPLLGPLLLTGVGGVVALGGGALLLAQESVLESKTSSGGAKESAVPLAITGLVGTSLGVVVAGVGATLLVME